MLFVQVSSELFPSSPPRIMAYGMVVTRYVSLKGSVNSFGMTGTTLPSSSSIPHFHQLSSSNKKIPNVNKEPLEAIGNLIARGFKGLRREEVSEYKKYT